LEHGLLHNPEDYRDRRCFARVSALRPEEFDSVTRQGKTRQTMSGLAVLARKESLSNSGTCGDRSELFLGDNHFSDNV
jgi:hypothetical protein